MGEVEPVTVETVEGAAVQLETSTRSVASKLRKMGYTVESSIVARTKTFTDAEEVQLEAFVTNHKGMFTYAEIALKVFEDVDRAREVQGKLLSMDLTSFVKKTPPKETVKQYSQEQEDIIIQMISDNAYIEEISEALNKSIPSVRGKILSMIRSHDISMPKQRESHAKDSVDALESLGDVSAKTVEEIAELLGKTMRGVKTMLTHRGITCVDYDGAARAEKIAEKEKEEEVA